MRGAPGLLTATLAGVAVACAAPAPVATALPWQSWEVVETGAAGVVQVDGERLLLGAGGPLTAVRWSGPVPRPPYELEFDAARLQGNDFFCGLSFPAGDGHLTLVLGGWGGALCGLSCLDEVDAAANGTAVYRGFAQGRDYHVRLRVETARVQVWLDAAPLLDVPLEGRRCRLRTEVADCAPLGLASYQTIARLGPVTLRGASDR